MLEPRALKRRALAACRSDKIRNLVKPPISAFDCTNKVMNNDIDFIVEALKEVSNDEAQALVRSYGN